MLLTILAVGLDLFFRSRLMKHGGKEAGDPRSSIERRYGNQNNYLSAIEVAANQLYQRGFLLKDDINRILGRALAFHSQLMQRDQHNTTCDYTIF